MISILARVAQWNARSENHYLERRIVFCADSESPRALTSTLGLWPLLAVGRETGCIPRPTQHLSFR
jgi:hypothetical protein